METWPEKGVSGGDSGRDRYWLTSVAAGRWAKRQWKQLPNLNLLLQRVK